MVMKRAFVFSLFILLTISNCRFPGLDKSILEFISILQFSQNRVGFSLRFQVSGMQGSGLVVRNGDESISISQDGQYSFAKIFSRGESFDVQIASQPSPPAQRCIVQAGTGILQENVNTVQVICKDATTISGSITGLLGSGLQLTNQSNSGNETITIGATSFAFTPLIKGASYELSVTSQPTSPWQTCSITSPASLTGTVPDAGLVVVVNCTTNFNSVTAQVIGIGSLGTLTPGNELQVQINGGEILQFTGDSSIPFPTALLSGSAYSLSILNAGGNIATGTCSIPSPSGNVQGPTNIVVINCSNGFIVQGTVSIPGGTPSSLIGSGAIITISNTSGTVFTSQNVLVNSGDTSFLFSTPIPAGAGFQVTISTQPSSPSQVCQLSGTGTAAPIVISSSVNDIVINCSLPDPSYITASAIYENTLDVILSTLVSGAEYRYTLGDGTQPNPTCASPNFTTTSLIPITDNSLSVVKSIQCKAGWLTSNVTTSGNYNLRVAIPVPSLVTNTAMNWNETVSFSTATTGGTWFCSNVSDVPTNPGNPSCGVTLNTCGSGTLGNFTHLGIISKNTKTVGCRVGFVGSTILASTYPVNSYVLSGTISGLTTPFAVNSFVLQNNLTDNTIISANGSYSFSAAIASGSNYSVTVLSNPNTPWQSCIVSNPTGTVTTSAINNVNLSCTTNMYNITGNVTGPNAGNLNPGTSLTLNTGSGTIVLNPGDSISASLGSGANYNLSITSQPQGQHCVFLNPNATLGTVAGANVNTLDINCVNGYFIGGQILTSIPPIDANYLLYQGNLSGTTIGAATSGYVNAPLATARLNSPRMLAFDGVNFYVADPGNRRIRRITTAGTVSDFVGSGTLGMLDGVGTTAQLGSPHGLATDGTFLYVSDTNFHNIRRIRISSAEVVTLAGNGTSGYLDGTGASAQFNGLYGLAIHENFLYIADRNNHYIRRLNLKTNQVTTLAGTGAPINSDGIGTAAGVREPINLVIVNGNLYFNSYSGHSIRRIDLGTTEVTTLAGSTSLAGFRDGPASTSLFNNPHGLTTDGKNLYIVEAGGSNRLRILNLRTNQVYTLAGSTTGGPALGIGSNAQLNNATSLVYDGKNLFLTEDHRVRRISNNGLIARYPLAGNPLDYSSEDSVVNNGVWTGAVTYGSDRLGEANSAAILNGTQYMATKDMFFDQTQSFGFSVWVKPSSIVEMGILGKLDFELRFKINPDGSLQFITYNTGAATKFLVTTSTNILKSNQWNHLLYRFDVNKWSANYAGEIFVNGMNVTLRSEDQTTGVPTRNTAGPIFVGGNVYNTTPDFQGSISDLRFYNRFLNDGEVNTLAQDALSSEVGSFYNSFATGLISHYELFGLTNPVRGLDQGPNKLNLTGVRGLPTDSIGRSGIASSSLGSTSGSLFKDPVGIPGLPEADHPRTVCAWVKPLLHPTNNGDRMIPFAYGNNSGNSGFALMMTKIAGLQYIGVHLFSAQATREYTIPLQIWSFLCATYDGANLDLYVNGSKIGTSAPLGTIATAQTSLEIGAGIGGVDVFFGSVDDVQVYNSALSQLQIRKLSAQNSRGLVARYDFLGDTQDLSGFNKTLVNSLASPTADRFGNANSAYFFNGTSAFMENTNSDLPLPLANGARSICAWVRANSTSLSGIRIVAAHGLSNAGDGFMVGVRDLDATPRVFGCAFGGPCSANALYPPFTWNHICSTQSGAPTTPTTRLYMNGRELTSAATTYSTTGTALTVGKLGVQYHFPGAIDEIAIYNRALTAGEILALAGYHPHQTTVYNPNSTALSNLKLFLAADRLSYLGNNAAVNTWFDDSGLGNVATAPGANPTITLVGPGNKPTIEFIRNGDGTGTTLTNNSFVGFSQSQMSLFLVATPSINNIMSYFNTASVNGGLTLFSTADQRINVDRQSVNNILNSPIGSYPSLQTNLISSVWTNGNTIDSNIWKNGNPQGTVGTAAGLLSASSNFVIGNNFQNNINFQGSISELIYFNNILNTNDRRIVECYLSSKYNISLNQLSSTCN